MGAVLLATQHRDWDTAQLGVVLLAIGPSTGHIYAGEVGRGLAMAGGRLALVGAGFVGYLGFGGSSCQRDDSCSMPKVVLGSGIAIASVLAVVDLLDADSAAERFNESQRAPRRQAWMVAPVVAQRQLGLVLAAPF